MNNMSQYDRVQLLRRCRREYNPYIFAKLVDDIIFKSADDYNRSPDCQNSIDPVPSGSTSARLSNHFMASFVISAMSLLMASFV